MRKDRDLGTIDALAAVVGGRAKARSLLQRLGIETVNEVFALSSLLDALAVQVRATSSAPASDDPVDIAREVLHEFGIAVVGELEGKRSTLLLRAEAADRYVVSYDLKYPVEPVRIASTHDRAAKATELRLYSTTQRRSGSPQFLASGFDEAGAPPLYLFVLASERRAWILTRDDLLELHEEVGRARRKGIAPGLSFAEHADREGTLRLWMPLGRWTGADPSERIAGPDRLLLRPHGSAQ